MTDEYRIPPGRETVWRALNDPEILKQCIPGCETVDKTSDTEFTARVSVAVGPVKAKFTGKVTLADLKPPESYTISGEGRRRPICGGTPKSFRLRRCDGEQRSARVRRCREWPVSS